MSNVSAIILAAGEGTRMKSKTPKVLHNLLGKPLVVNVIDRTRELGIEEVIIVIGHGADKIKESLGEKCKYALQEKQLGTGHAVMQAIPYLSNSSKYTLLLYGDTPLITSDSLRKLLDIHQQQDNKATVITSFLDNPTGYGRIIRADNDDIEGIVEEKDANPEQKKIKEVNSGMYCFDTETLVKYINAIKNNNAQGEYYITDILEIIRKEGYRVGALIIDEEEIKGINNRVQLAEGQVILQKRVLDNLMTNGVTIIDPKNTYIDSTVRVSRDTIILPGSIIQGDTEIGEDCIIGPNSRISNCKIGDGVVIENSVALDSKVDNDSKIGPFAYLRPGSKLGKNVKIGDFVEVKNSIIGDNSKASHLAYLGDADIGNNVNIGCGVVVVNYDGVKKHRTTIEDNSFVGCNVNLVSPVAIKEGAYVAAGSTITENVPKGSLAIARSKQVVKEGWTLKSKEKDNK